MRTTDLHLLQQPPFRFVHSLIDWDTQGAETEFLIGSQTFFLKEGKLHVAGLIENIAQSCAAWMGQLASERGKELHIMPLCAVNKMQVFRYPYVADTIRTVIRQIDADFGVVLLHADVFIGAEQIVTAEIKVGE